MASEPVLFPDFTKIPLALTEEVQLSYIDNHRESAQPPLVLLHGIFDNKSTWFRLASRLAEYRLIAPDLVGHGFSSKPTFDGYPEHQRYSPDMQTEFLKYFINALNLDTMVLVGNSLGGGLALRLYLNYPELAKKIRGLVLIDAAGYPQRLPERLREIGRWQGQLMTHAPIHTLVRWSGLLYLLTCYTFRRSFYDRRKVPSELVSTALTSFRTPNIFYAYHRSAQNIVPPDIESFHLRFGEITCPTLILWGGQDRVLPPQTAYRFYTEILNSELYIFENCGHAPHLEYPAETAQRIGQWLKKNQ